MIWTLLFINILHSTEYSSIYFRVYGRCDIFFLYGNELQSCFSQSEDKTPFQIWAHISDNTLNSTYIKRTIYVYVYRCRILFDIKGIMGIFWDCLNKLGELPQLVFPRSSIIYRCLRVEVICDVIFVYYQMMTPQHDDPMGHDMAPNK